MTVSGEQLKQFPSAGPTQDADLLYTSQNGVEAATPASQLAAYANAKVNPASLPARNTLTGTEKLAILQGGSLVSATVNDLTVTSATRETFVAGAGFTPGVTTSITLAGSYGSINNIGVFFDGGAQFDCTLSGKVLGFNPVVPQGVQTINVTGGASRTVGAPSAGTVIDSSVAPGAGINTSKSLYVSGYPGSVPRTVTSKFRDFASIGEFAPAGDGSTSDTTAVLSAVGCGARGLYIPTPAVAYRTTAPIPIPTGMKIVGDSVTPYQGTGPFPGNRGPGSWFFLDHPGQGFVVGDPTETTFLTGVEFNGIGTYRNHTTPIGPGWTPTVFDFDFVFHNTAFLMENVCALNAYKAIHIPNNFGTRATIKNLFGQWFSVGVQADLIEDTLEIDGIHHWPFWANLPDVTNYQLANTTLLSMARVDDPIINNLFSIFANRVFGFFQSAAGKTGRVLATNISCDQNNCPIFVDPAVNFLTAQFVNMTLEGPATPSASGIGIEFNGTNAQVDFVNLQGELMSNSMLSVGGTNNDIRIANLSCDGWGAAGGSAPLINLFTGGGGNKVSVSGKMRLTGEDGPYSNVVVSAPAGTMFTNPDGVVSGTATIGASATSVTINHGLPIPPTTYQIKLDLASGIGAAKSVFKSNITATTFQINLDTAPGAPVFIDYRCALE